MPPSRRFGKTGVGDRVLSTRFDAGSMIRLVDRTRRSFGPGFHTALADAHERVAVKIQVAMVEALKRSIQETGRNQRQGNRLEMSLMDERNREVTASNFTVLLPSWMNRSPAELYWRQIEEGSNRVYQGYILFANGSRGGGGGLSARGKAYGPYRPGGQRASNGRSQAAPPGYKHSSLIMTTYGRGGWSSSIGPFPAYHYTRGGTKAMHNTSMRVEYTRALRPLDIKFSEIARPE